MIALLRVQLKPLVLTFDFVYGLQITTTYQVSCEIVEKELSEDRKEPLTKKKIDRRSILKWTGAIGLGLAAGAGLEYTSIQVLKPPMTAPGSATTSTVTISELFKNRKSTNAFQTQPLPKEKLLSLLWAA